MNKEKENATVDYARMIEQSWTYAKMTDEERKRWHKLLFDSGICYDAIKGSYMKRWDILSALYEAFLAGLGYDGSFWRAKENDDDILF